MIDKVLSERRKYTCVCVPQVKMSVPQTLLLIHLLLDQLTNVFSNLTYQHMTVYLLPNAISNDDLIYLFLQAGY